ncbi:unnamed protein product [Lepeophtheirus salmonis]|uniref:(salmon louse) hypothetical protein n=1 Tax=Lepeophtheirus salmonis TaxID=72036 RepID=A0A7R8CPD2_LEPSM|nr:unnamed protein product [Lepeophtheirus salmonis]CAF2848422.1 unnamed protein product [Lepeophtheirus salmonis]
MEYPEDNQNFIFPPHQDKSFTSNLPPEDIRAGFVLSILISVIGSIINLITLISLCRSKNLCTTGCVIQVCYPPGPVNNHLCGIVCRLYAFIFYWNITVMMMNQAALAFNRYILLCHPPESVIKFNRLTNILILGSVWLLPFLALLVPLTGLWGNMGFDDGTGTCTMIDSKRGERISPANISNNWPSLKKTVKNLECQNSQIKEQKNSNGRSKKESRISLTLFMIFLSFVICTAPPALVLAIDPSAKLYPHWHIPLYAFGWCFGLINPCIYIILNASYRKAFIELFKDLKACISEN